MNGRIVAAVQIGPIARTQSGGGSFPRRFQTRTVPGRTPIAAAISLIP
jgi:hypothetical protein